MDKNADVLIKDKTAGCFLILYLQCKGRYGIDHRNVESKSDFGLLWIAFEELKG